MFIIAASGCGKKHPVDKVIYVPEDDPRMNAAMEKARSTAQTFIAALKSPKPGQSAFAVKIQVIDGKNVEYIWLNKVSFDGQGFQGTVNNEPEKVKNVKMGQKMSIELASISTAAKWPTKKRPVA